MTEDTVSRNSWPRLSPTVLQRESCAPARIDGHGFMCLSFRAGSWPQRSMDRHQEGPLQILLTLLAAARNDPALLNALRGH